MELQAVIDDVLAEAQQKKVNLRRTTIFCDTLTIKSSTSIGWKNDSGFRLRIYTRRVVAESSPALSMVLNEGASLALLATEVPEDFQVSFRTGTLGEQTAVAFVPRDAFGIEAQFEGGKVVPSMLKGPDVESIESIDYFKQLDEDGTLNSDMWVDDNLPRLLQFQFLVASTQIDRNRALALQLLNFVCTASNTPASRDFNIQATALRSSILARQATNVSLVPSVNVFHSKNILKARLSAAASFENAFQSFISQEKTSQNLTLFASNAIDSNRNALSEYAFLEENSRQAFSSATKSFDIAQSNYIKRQSELDAAGKRFEKGIKDWKLKQELEAAKEILLAVVEVAGAIVATVATAGAAAPVAGLAIANAASKGAKVVGLIGRIKEIVVKIKGLYEKFKPLIEKLKGLVEAIQKMLEIVSQAKRMSDMPKELEPADSTLDPINANALWDAFTIDVAVMFQELESYPIEGKTEYQTLLLKLPIYAKAFLTAQVAVVTSGQGLAVILLRKKLDTEQQSRLEGTLTHIKDDSTLLALLKRAMFDRVLAVRNLVYLDFWTYKAAFQYYSLTSESDLNVYTSAVQRISDYQTDAARLQAAVNSFGATVRIQQKSFLLIMPLEADQRNSLQNSGTLSFAPAIDAEAFDGFCRIRLSRARAFLEGAKSSSETSTVRLHIKTTGRFYDRDFPYSQRPQAVTTSPAGDSLRISNSSNHGRTLVEPLLPRAFIGEPRTIAFEYAGRDQVLCDGYFGLQNDYTKQTPFQEWTLQVKPGAQGGLDWTSVKAVRWEFLCEVCAT